MSSFSSPLCPGLRRSGLHLSLSGSPAWPGPRGLGQCLSSPPPLCWRRSALLPSQLREGSQLVSPAFSPKLLRRPSPFSHHGGRLLFSRKDSQVCKNCVMARAGRGCSFLFSTLRTKALCLRAPGSCVFGTRRFTTGLLAAFDNFKEVSALHSCVCVCAYRCLVGRIWEQGR